MYKIIFYKTIEGECSVKEFIKSRNENNRSKIFSILDLLKEKGYNLHRPLADYLRDGIHELRIKLSGEESRMLYFFCYENYIVLTHTFIKNTDEVPNKEIEKALKCKDDFLNRYNIQNIEELLQWNNKN